MLATVMVRQDSSNIMSEKKRRARNMCMPLSCYSKNINNSDTRKNIKDGMASKHSRPCAYGARCVGTQCPSTSSHAVMVRARMWSSDVKVPPPWDVTHTSCTGVCVRAAVASCGPWPVCGAGTGSWEIVVHVWRAPTMPSPDAAPCTRSVHCG